MRPHTKSITSCHGAGSATIRTPCVGTLDGSGDLTIAGTLAALDAAVTNTISGATLTLSGNAYGGTLSFLDGVFANTISGATLTLSGNAYGGTLSFLDGVFANTISGTTLTLSANIYAGTASVGNLASAGTQCLQASAAGKISGTGTTCPVTGAGSVAYGSFAGLPTQPQSQGVTYFATDSPWEAVSTGTTWNYWYAGIPSIPPPTASWSWFNQGTASVTNTTTGTLQFQQQIDPSGGNRFYYRSPAYTVNSGYTVEIGMSLLPSVTDFFDIGIGVGLSAATYSTVVLQDADSSQIPNAAYCLNGSCTAFGNYTGLSATANFKLKVQDDGSTYNKFYISPNADPNNWILIGTASRVVSPTWVGIELIRVSNNATDYVLVWDWEEYNTVH